MWIFLLTDAMSFGGLLLAYAILRSGSHNWPDPATRLGIPFTAGMTFLLICSSVTMVLALAAAQEKNKKQALSGSGCTILGGLLFLCGQAKEYTELIHEKGDGAVGRPDVVDLLPHHRLPRPARVHRRHLPDGHLLPGHGRQVHRRAERHANHIEIAGLFWHFVDLVWILVFTFIYLI